MRVLFNLQQYTKWKDLDTNVIFLYKKPRQQNIIKIMFIELKSFTADARLYRADVRIQNSDT